MFGFFHCAYNTKSKIIFNTHIPFALLLRVIVCLDVYSGLKRVIYIVVK